MNISNLTFYRWHQKKVYTCVKAKYSKSMGTRGKVGGGPQSPTQCYVWCPTTFPLALSVLSTRLNKSVDFLLGEAVNTILLTWPDMTQGIVDE